VPKPRKKSRPPRDQGRALPAPLIDGLAEVEELLEDEEWEAAVDLLEPLNRRYPRQPIVLAMLVAAYQELGELEPALPLARQLAALRPNDPAIQLMAATTYLGASYPFLAVEGFRRYVERWPDGEDVDNARETIEGLEAEYPAMLADMQLTGEDGPELARLVEEGRALLEEGHYARARQNFEAVLRRRPDHRPALAIIGMSHNLEGNRAGAIAHAQRVLALDPANVHALGSLAENLYLSGRAEEARPWAERLYAVAADSPDAALKQVDVASYFGDDERVLALAEQAERANYPVTPMRPMLLHLTAVALLRQGREPEARAAWEQALDQRPDFDLAQDNLDDLAKPIDEQHAPWPYSFADWFSPRATADLGRDILPAIQRRNGENFRRAIRRYARQHPTLIPLTPALLDRGDPRGRVLAVQTALSLRTPEMMQALRDFAAGSRGPAALRRQAAEASNEQ
jgi:tetratricopeptide (TPR) repeat protein